MGNSTITITTDDGAKCTLEIEVLEQKNEIAVTGASTLKVGESFKLNANVKIHIVYQSDQIVWTTDNNEIVTLDNGCEQVTKDVPPDNFSDSVTISALKPGKATITCSLVGGGVEYKFPVQVLTEAEMEIYKSASRWMGQYNEFTNAMSNALQRDATVDVKGDNIPDTVKKIMNQLNDLGLQIFSANITPLTREQEMRIAQALIQVFAEQTSNVLTVSDVDMDNLDMISISADIVEKVYKGIRTTNRKIPLDNGVEIELQITDYFGAKMGTAIYWKNGVDVASAFITTDINTVEKILDNYLKDLLDLEKISLKTAAKEALKEMSNALFGKSLSDLKKGAVRKAVEKCQGALSKAGLGAVLENVNNCYNFYQYVQGILSCDFTNLNDLEFNIKSLKFEDKSIKDNGTKLALDGLESLRKGLLNEISNSLHGTDKRLFDW